MRFTFYPSSNASSALCVWPVAVSNSAVHLGSDACIPGEL